MARGLSLTLPAQIADEIASAAARAERTVGFLVLGAMKSAGPLAGPMPDGVSRELAVTTDEDDPKDLGARLKKLAAEKGKGLSLDHALALAWVARRAAILAWVDRIAQVNVGERADDLDEGLREASAEGTSPERLIELAKSAYPRVRALVVAHPKVPEAALAILRKDPEKAVRLALQEKG